jgi:hypothetical protein
MKAAGLTGFFFELRVELEAVLVQRAHVGAAGQGAGAAGGVPGGAGGQLRSFDQHDLAPAGLGQMIGDAAARNATTDYYYARMAFHALLSPLRDGDGAR